MRLHRVVHALPAAILPLCFAACSAVAIKVPVMRPAEINMASYTTVGMGEFHFVGNSNSPRALADALEEALLGSQRFQVIDRQRMGAGMHELNLSANELADLHTAAKLGKLVAAGALVFGEVEERYQEANTDDHSQDSDNKQHTLHKLRGDARVICNFKIVDVATGSLLIAKRYEETRTDTNYGRDSDRPQPIDREALFSAARREVVSRFMKAIVPHQEYQYANFEKDSAMPQLEGGIGWAERGEWQKAQDAFTATIADAEKNTQIKPSQLAKAYGDLGLSYGFAAAYDKAYPLFEKAFQLSNNQAYLDERDQVKQLDADAQKVESQTAPPPGSN